MTAHSANHWLDLRRTFGINSTYIVDGYAMNRLIVKASVALALCSTFMVQAGMVTQSNVTIRRLGSHDGVTFYFDLQEGFNAPCAYGLVYCYASNPDCKNRYATALIAKTTGTRLVEIRYDHSSQDNACTLYLMTVE